MKNYSLLLSFILLVAISLSCKSDATTAEKQGQSRGVATIKALIVDGQNNHAMWPKITFQMKQFLEETGKFEVDISRTAYTWNGEDYLADYSLEGVTTEALEKPKADPNFKPDFAKYDVVISNFGWNAADWPQETQKALEEFVSGGGGLVIVHAADNSFPKWKAFNQMIGLGGWGDRNEKDGPYVYYTDAGELVHDTTAGRCGSHGPQHEFMIQIREPEHPITKGMPSTWMHAQDELYDRLRGPAENMTVLATAYSAEDKKGTGRHEPMMLTIDYGKGRVFHTPMGHADYSVACVGFISTLQRGTEWAATGKVTISLPDDFPTGEQSSQRAF